MLVSYNFVDVVHAWPDLLCPPDKFGRALFPKLGAGWAQPLELGAKMQGTGRGGGEAGWEPLRLSTTCAERAQDARKLAFPTFSGILAETFHFGEF